MRILGCILFGVLSVIIQLSVTVDAQCNGTTTCLHNGIFDNSSCTCDCQKNPAYSGKKDFEMRKIKRINLKQKKVSTVST